MGYSAARGRCGAPSGRVGCLACVESKSPKTERSASSTAFSSSAARTFTIGQGRQMRRVGSRPQLPSDSLIGCRVAFVRGRSGRPIETTSNAPSAGARRLDAAL